MDPTEVDLPPLPGSWRSGCLARRRRSYSRHHQLLPSPPRRMARSSPRCALAAGRTRGREHDPRSRRPRLPALARGGQPLLAHRDDGAAPGRPLGRRAARRPRRSSWRARPPSRIGSRPPQARSRCCVRLPGSAARSAERVWRLVDWALPLAEAYMLRRYLLSGDTSTEIAGVMGVTGAAVRYRLHRAIWRLRVVQDLAWDIPLETLREPPRGPLAAAVHLRRRRDVGRASRRAWREEPARLAGECAAADRDRRRPPQRPAKTRKDVAGIRDTLLELQRRKLWFLATPQATKGKSFRMPVGMGEGGVRSGSGMGRGSLCQAEAKRRAGRPENSCWSKLAACAIRYSTSPIRTIAASCAIARCPWNCRTTTRAATATPSCDVRIGQVVVAAACAMAGVSIESLRQARRHRPRLPEGDYARRAHARAVCHPAGRHAPREAHRGAGRRRRHGGS